MLAQYDLLSFIDLSASVTFGQQIFSPTHACIQFQSGLNQLLQFHRNCLNYNTFFFFLFKIVIGVYSQILKETRQSQIIGLALTLVQR